MSISENILSVKDRIDSICRSAGRVNDVRLVAVSKTVDINRIKEAVECGIDTLGENKVQEIISKFPYMQMNIEWHMIGHLQTNKVKYIVDKVSLIQSLDSTNLAGEINKQFKKHGRIIDVLVEINIGREESKYGIDPDDTENFIREVSKLSNIRICGLMTVAPELLDKEQVRPYFRQMKEIYDKIKSSNIDNVDMKYLSMGMTNDFEVAVEEGSNMVRIGSGIFGKRVYKV